MNAISPWDVYMSGALSALSKEDYLYLTKIIYERVENVCQKIGLRCYLPHKSQTTPTKGMPHAKVWEIDYKRVVNSSAIVAYIGMPALGVGAEIEMARTANVPVILLFESSKQEDLSRLILGNPAIKFTIPFDKPEEIDEQLRAYLTLIFSKKNLDEVATLEKWPFPKWNEMQKRLIVMENTAQKNTDFRDFPSKPVSFEEWSEYGQEWDKNNSKEKNSIKPRAHLDDFA
jgi:hypothetical protein